MKSVTQTGAKTKLGGLNEGFCKVAYHVSIEGAVKNEPIMPAIWQIRIAIINLIHLFIYKNMERSGFIYN
jgi:hypothetical protein